MPFEATNYLHTLARRLRLDPVEKDEIIQELEAHLEDKATALAKKSDSDVVTEGIALLFQVQKELNTNAQKHLEILSRKNAHGTSKGDLSDKGGHVCH